uniref:Uncharacterized protein n=1 Tax=Cacopsylla melanoneura TaxID=428564 RepID=A0A8D8RZR4_9HEMI
MHLDSQGCRIHIFPCSQEEFHNTKVERVMRRRLSLVREIFHPVSQTSVGLDDQNSSIVCFLGVRIRDLSPLIQGLVHFRQITGLVVNQIGRFLASLSARYVGFVLEVFRLIKVFHSVNAPPINAFVEPEFENIFHDFLQLPISVVQIRLCLTELMEVPHLSLLNISPR